MWVDRNSIACGCGKCAYRDGCECRCVWVGDDVRSVNVSVDSRD